jgi:hypothetical protein
VKVMLDSWFSLPRLGTAHFSALMKQGVKYDKDLGFKIDSATDVPGAMGTLRSALGEEVDLTLRCFVCGREACPGCSYSASCDRTKVSPVCLCADHFSGSDSFETYEKTVIDNLGE